ncbi:MAG: hypothetical protein Q8O13_10375 [Candidatus Omnitrophota bacterium]|nr:hypothetical protein [Candidatus Omnitrophota bacterium]
MKQDLIKKLIVAALAVCVFFFSATAGYCLIDLSVIVENGGGGGGGGSSSSRQRAFQHLYESMDRYETSGIRLIESFSYPYPDGQFGTAWVYDNALAIIALVSRGYPEDKARARLLCETLIWAQHHDPNGYNDGRLRDSYWATDIDPNGPNGAAAAKDPNTSTGNMAWTIIAWLYYYNHAGDSDQAFRQQVLDAAKWLGNFLETAWSPAGPYPGYHIGYAGWDPYVIDPDIKSTEQNADLYIAFKRLSETPSAESYWLSQALRARTFVLSMRNAGQSRYYVGTTETGAINDNPQALDANAMPILSLNDFTPINWIENNCHLFSDGFEGFDFNNDRDGIWFEGTGQMAVVYKMAGRSLDSRKYILQMRQAQNIPAPYGNGKGIISASHDGVSTGFEWWLLFKSMSLSATSWFIFAEFGLNPFN